MNADLDLWYAARAAAMAAFFVLAASLLTGEAVRTAYLAPLARNRAVLALHSFLAWFWLPLICVHVVCLVLDSTARIRWVDLFVPFRVDVGAGSTLAIGLGTCGFLLLILVFIAALMRARMPAAAWFWVHRLSYPMFVVFLVHAQLAGTDFSRTAISVVGWATLGMLLMLAVPRLMNARVGQRETTPVA